MPAFTTMVGGGGRTMGLQLPRQQAQQNPQRASVDAANYASRMRTAQAARPAGGVAPQQAALNAAAPQQEAQRAMQAYNLANANAAYQRLPSASQNLANTRAPGVAGAAVTGSNPANYAARLNDAAAIAAQPAQAQSAQSYNSAMAAARPAASPNLRGINPGTGAAQSAMAAAIPATAAAPTLMPPNRNLLAGSAAAAPAPNPRASRQRPAWMR